jgi:L-aminopeptidase/D-esterase-like protein
MTLTVPSLDLDPGSITDVAGLRVGHAAASGRPTGCTVVLCPQGVTAGVAVRGGAPGTRETDLLRPENTVQQVHAILLTGGSAFGLDAAGGVMRWLDERGHGLAVGPPRGEGPGARPVRVPIVPAAVLFDLWIGDPSIRPDASTGYAACETASASPPAQGSVGAGLGATVGKLWGIAQAMKGGIGTASLRHEGVTVAALVAVNAIGDVIDEQGRVLAGARGPDGPGFVVSTRSLLAGHTPPRLIRDRTTNGPGSATTIGLVATDARLDKAGASQLASLAHHGLARAVSPLTADDGDTMFALATGAAGDGLGVTTLGILAAEAVSRAIRNAARAASGCSDPWLPAAREFGTR